MEVQVSGDVDMVAGNLAQALVQDLALALALVPALTVNQWATGERRDLEMEEKHLLQRNNLFIRLKNQINPHSIYSNKSR